MKKLFNFVLTALIGSMLISNVNASGVTYTGSGTQNIDLYTFTATTTGEIGAYFLGATASYTNTLTMKVNGVETPQSSAGLLNNHTSHIGDFVSLGHVHAGDVLTFQLNVLTTGNTWDSDKSFNNDGLNHIFSSSYSGDASLHIPAGTYIGFEDIARGGDFDYNDETFVFTNISSVVSPVPEPETYAMLLIGLMVIGYAIRNNRRDELSGMSV